MEKYLCRGLAGETVRLVKALKQVQERHSGDWFLKSQ